MGIIAVIIIIAIMAWFSSLPDDNNYNTRNSWEPYRNDYHNKSGSSHRIGESFEENGSYYDRDGNEHLVDEDMYCEDCDDYHDFD